jgi:hypothetical protein
MTTLTPPAAIQQGRKDVQYLPKPFMDALPLQEFLAALMKAGGVLEIAPELRRALELEEFTNSGKAVLVWTPVKKNSMGDIVFDSEGAPAVRHDMPRYVQVVNRPADPTIVQPKSALLASGPVSVQ